MRGFQQCKQRGWVAYAGMKPSRRRCVSFKDGCADRVVRIAPRSPHERLDIGLKRGRRLKIEKGRDEVK